MIRGLILDYGEVLCRRPSAETFARLASAASLSPDEFLSRYFASRDLYDKGELTPQQYWGAIASTSNASLIDQFRRWDLEMWSDIDHGMLDWLAEIRLTGIRTALLSNMPADMAVYVRREHHWLQAFDHLTLSCEIGIIKPSAEIYLHSAKGLQLPPAELCFIDDREVNVKAARQAGLQALLFEGLEKLKRDLADLGLAT